ncbi:HNH endonuclease [Halomarina litorea]|uniref:HNH endonuclease n=1 Tax=Halomarina litorea TaxID=2961595 RepID=UPI0020C3EBF2|nr:HNH endonuclease [Halomarina sp. BCD28]
MSLPPEVKTYRDLIAYQYAQLIGVAAGIDDHGFIFSKFYKLQAGEIEMSSLTKEDKYQLQEGVASCIYCGSEDDIGFDHIIPRSTGGPDTISNQVPACQSCNSSKGDRDVIDWFRNQSCPIPRLVWGKYLKHLYEHRKTEGTLDESLPNDERNRWEGAEVTRTVSKRIRKRYRDSSSETPISTGRSEPVNRSLSEFGAE